MINKTDDQNDTLEACCVTAKLIERFPEDYYRGLPDPILTLPKNILLFHRQTVFAQETDAIHHHHRFLLIVCLQENGTVMVDDHVARLQPGFALLITPYQFHHYTRFIKQDLLWIFISFDLDNSEEFSFLRGKALKLSPQQINHLNQIITCYAALDKKRFPSSKTVLLLALLLEEFRAIFKERKSSPDLAPSSHLIHDVTRYVNHHVAEAIQISDVAKAIGFSESYLRAQFHALAGIGLGSYIRRLRFHRARTMILTTDFLLKEIAEQCGYASIYTFSRAFSREMGMSPSRYRSQNRPHKTSI